MAQFDWRTVEPESDHELAQLINAAWPLRPNLDRVGPAMVLRKQGELVVDGEYVRVYALGGFPATILTDWWAHLADSDLPVDIAMDVCPRDVGEGKRHLDRREIALSTSRHSREREVALEQVRALAMAMERSQVKPFDVSLTMAIGPTRAPSCRSSTAGCTSACATAGNARLHRLTWEQWEGLERIAPLGRLPLPRRTRRVETGTLARTTPLSSATLLLEGGVVLGEAGNAPCLFWTRAGQKNAHMAIYGGSGAGQGSQIRTNRLDTRSSPTRLPSSGGSSSTCSSTRRDVDEVAISRLRRLAVQVGRESARIFVLLVAVDRPQARQPIFSSTRPSTCCGPPRPRRG